MPSVTETNEINDNIDADIGDITSKDMGEALALVKQYILYTNAFPTRVEQTEFLSGIVKKFPHLGNEKKWKARVSPLSG